MYAHSSTFYLSRSGSKLIERPSYYWYSFKHPIIPEITPG